MTEQLQGGWAAPRRVGQSKAGGPPQGGWAAPRRVGQSKAGGPRHTAPFTRFTVRGFAWMGVDFFLPLLNINLNFKSDTLKKFLSN